MKALRFHAARDLRLEDIAPPATPAAGEVVVKVSQCGICGSDIHEFLDGPIFIPTEPHPLTGATAPLVLGHEFSGTISAAGAGAKVRQGDRVAILPHLNMPGDYFVRRGQGHISNTTALVGLSSAYGGMGEYAIVPEANVVRLPDSVTDEQGAMFEPCAVAMNAVDRGGVFAGSSVLVTGAGPIGVLVAMAARAAGASRILVSEANPARRARLEGLKLGFVVLDPSRPDFAEAVEAATEEALGVDVAIECAGHERALADCIRLTRRGGTVVQVGIFVDAPRVDMRLLTAKAVTLTTSWGFPITIGPRIIQMIATGQLTPERIITGRVTLADAIAHGFDELSRPDHDHLKVLISLAG